MMIGKTKNVTKQQPNPCIRKTNVNVVLAITTKRKVSEDVMIRKRKPLEIYMGIEK